MEMKRVKIRRVLHESALAESRWPTTRLLAQRCTRGLLRDCAYSPCLRCVYDWSTLPGGNFDAAQSRQTAVYTSPKSWITLPGGSYAVVNLSAYAVAVP